MKIKSSIANFATVMVLLYPQQLLHLSSLSAIQHIVEAAVPWFNIAVATCKIIEFAREFFNEKDKTDSKDKTYNSDKN
jgi:flagellar biosynthesis/type III secretory pathway M-ring protein FliF/YscJ